MTPHLEKQSACAPLIANSWRRPFCSEAELYTQYLPPDQADQ